MAIYQVTQNIKHTKWYVSISLMPCPTRGLAGPTGRRGKFGRKSMGGKTRQTTVQINEKSVHAGKIDQNGTRGSRVKRWNRGVKNIQILVQRGKKILFLYRARPGVNKIRFWYSGGGGWWGYRSVLPPPRTLYIGIALHHVESYCTISIRSLM